MQRRTKLKMHREKKNIIRVKMRKNYKHDASKKYECRGRGADSKWGVQKVKGRKKNRGARVWACETGFGPV